MSDTQRTMNDVADRYCDSPIERAFLLAYFRLLGERCSFLHIGVKDAGTGFSIMDGYKVTPWLQPGLYYHRPQTDMLWIQLPVENYRVDFAVARVCAQQAFRGNEPTGLATVKTPILVVECDGHEFHERTKEQAQRDRSRDRDLTALGFRVMRFTGSEIHKDPDGCAREVDDLLNSLAVAGARM